MSGHGTAPRDSIAPYNQGRAFTAARKQSLLQLTSQVSPPKPTNSLAQQLDANAGKIRRRRSNSDPAKYLMVGSASNGLGIDGSLERQHRRVQSSTEMKPARLRTSTSGSQLDGIKSGGFSDLQTTLVNPDHRSGGQIQRELSQARRRGEDLASSSGWRNIVLEEAQKNTGRQEITWI